MTLFTEEIAKEIAESLNHTYNGTKMIGKKRYVDITCDKSHNFQARWETYKNGMFCKECKKIIYTNNLISYVESRGDKLLARDGQRLTIKCKCGEIYYPTISNYKNQYGCNKCGVKRTSLSKEYVSEYISSLKEGYELVSDYVNSYTPISIKCDRKHVYDIRFNQLKEKGTLCPYCKEEDEFKYKSGILAIDRYKFIGDSTSSGIICNNGHITGMKFHDFKEGHRCKYCVGNNIKHTIEYVKSYIESFGYKLISNIYVNNKTPLDIQCCKGHNFSMRFDVFKRGVRCPICDCSSGEAEIMRILDDNNIVNMYQYTFDNCKDKKELPFDFYIPSMNTLIEFDGEQHFRPVEWFGGKRAYNLCKKHDEIKNQYCNIHKIKLIRIPYWDLKNIEQILKDNQII